MKIQFIYNLLDIENMIQNPAELQAVLMIASKLQEEGEDYRIISPYAAQTNAIQETMKAEGLSWANKCFNVDSFQGNKSFLSIIQ